MPQKPDPTKTFILPAPVRNLLLEYLYQRPYGEVANGVALLNGLREVDDTPKQEGPIVALRAVKEPSDYPAQDAPQVPHDLPTL
jgi:hypothetical protein